MKTRIQSDSPPIPPSSKENLKERTTGGQRLENGGEGESRAEAGAASLKVGADGVGPVALKLVAEELRVVKVKGGPPGETVAESYWGAVRAGGVCQSPKGTWEPISS